MLAYITANELDAIFKKEGVQVFDRLSKFSSLIKKNVGMIRKAAQDDGTHSELVELYEDVIEGDNGKNLMGVEREINEGIGKLPEGLSTEEQLSFILSDYDRLLRVMILEGVRKRIEDEAVKKGEDVTSLVARPLHAGQLSFLKGKNNASMALRQAREYFLSLDLDKFYLDDAENLKSKNPDLLKEKKRVYAKIKKYGVEYTKLSKDLDNTVEFFFGALGKKIKDYRFINQFKTSVKKQLDKIRGKLGDFKEVIDITKQILKLENAPKDETESEKVKRLENIEKLKVILENKKKETIDFEAFATAIMKSLKKRISSSEKKRTSSSDIEALVKVGFIEPVLTNSDSILSKIVENIKALAEEGVSVSEIEVKNSAIDDETISSEEEGESILEKLTPSQLFIKKARWVNYWTKPTSTGISNLLYHNMNKKVREEKLNVPGDPFDVLVNLFLFTSPKDIDSVLRRKTQNKKAFMQHIAADDVLSPDAIENVQKIALATVTLENIAQIKGILSVLIKDLKLMAEQFSKIKEKVGPTEKTIDSLQSLFNNIDSVFEQISQEDGTKNDLVALIPISEKISNILEYLKGLKSTFWFSAEKAAAIANFANTGSIAAVCVGILAFQTRNNENVETILKTLINTSKKMHPNVDVEAIINNFKGRLQNIEDTASYDEAVMYFYNGIDTVVNNLRGPNGIKAVNELLNIKSDLSSNFGRVFYNGTFSARRKPIPNTLIKNNCEKLVKALKNSANAISDKKVVVELTLQQASEAIFNLLSEKQSLDLDPNSTEEQKKEIEDKILEFKEKHKEQYDYCVSLLSQVEELPDYKNANDLLGEIKESLSQKKVLESELRKKVQNYNAFLKELLESSNLSGIKLPPSIVSAVLVTFKRKEKEYKDAIYNIENAKNEKIKDKLLSQVGFGDLNILQKTSMALTDLNMRIGKALAVIKANEEVGKVRAAKVELGSIFKGKYPETTKSDIFHTQGVFDTQNQVLAEEISDLTKKISDIAQEIVTKVSGDLFSNPSVFNKKQELNEISEVVQGYTSSEEYIKLKDLLGNENLSEIILEATVRICALNYAKAKANSELEDVLNGENSITELELKKEMVNDRIRTLLENSFEEDDSVREYFEKREYSILNIYKDAKNVLLLKNDFDVARETLKDLAGKSDLSEKDVLEAKSCESSIFSYLNNLRTSINNLSEDVNKKTIVQDTKKEIAQLEEQLIELKETRKSKSSKYLDKQIEHITNRLEALKNFSISDTMHTKNTILNTLLEIESEIFPEGKGDVSKKTEILKKDISELSEKIRRQYKEGEGLAQLRNQREERDNELKQHMDKKLKEMIEDQKSLEQTVLEGGETAFREKQRNPRAYFGGVLFTLGYNIGLAGSLRGLSFYDVYPNNSNPGFRRLMSYMVSYCTRILRNYGLTSSTKVTVDAVTGNPVNPTDMKNLIIGFKNELTYKLRLEYLDAFPSNEVAKEVDINKYNNAVKTLFFNYFIPTGKIENEFLDRFLVTSKDEIKKKEPSADKFNGIITSKVIRDNGIVREERMRDFTDSLSEDAEGRTPLLDEVEQTVATSPNTEKFQSPEVIFMELIKKESALSDFVRSLLTRGEGRSDAKAFLYWRSYFSILDNQDPSAKEFTEIEEKYNGISLLLERAHNYVYELPSVIDSSKDPDLKNKQNLNFDGLVKDDLVKKLETYIEGALDPKLDVFVKDLLRFIRYTPELKNVENIKNIVANIERLASGDNESTEWDRLNEIFKEAKKVQIIFDKAKGRDKFEELFGLKKYIVDYNTKIGDISSLLEDLGKIDENNPGVISYNSLIIDDEGNLQNPTKEVKELVKGILHKVKSKNVETKAGNINAILESASEIKNNYISLLKEDKDTASIAAIKEYFEEENTKNLLELLEALDTESDIMDCIKILSADKYLLTTRMDYNSWGVGRPTDFTDFEERKKEGMKYSRYWQNDSNMEEVNEYFIESIQSGEIVREVLTPEREKVVASAFGVDRLSKVKKYAETPFTLEESGEDVVYFLKKRRVKRVKEKNKNIYADAVNTAAIEKMITIFVTPQFINNYLTDNNESWHKDLYETYPSFVELVKKTLNGDSKASQFLNKSNVSIRKVEDKYIVSGITDEILNEDLNISKDSKENTVLMVLAGDVKNTLTTNLQSKMTGEIPKIIVLPEYINAAKKELKELKSGPKTQETKERIITLVNSIKSYVNIKENVVSQLLNRKDEDYFKGLDRKINRLLRNLNSENIVDVYNISEAITRLRLGISESREKGKGTSAKISKNLELYRNLFRTLLRENASQKPASSILSNFKEIIEDISTGANRDKKREESIKKYKDSEVENIKEDINLLKDAYTSFDNANRKLREVILDRNDLLNDQEDLDKNSPEYDTLLEDSEEELDKNMGIITLLVGRIIGLVVLHESPNVNIPKDLRAALKEFEEGKDSTDVLNKILLGVEELKGGISKKISNKTKKIQEVSLQAPDTTFAKASLARLRTLLSAMRYTNTSLDAEGKRTSPFDVFKGVFQNEKMSAREFSNLLKADPEVIATINAISDPKKRDERFTQIVKEKYSEYLGSVVPEDKLTKEQFRKLQLRLYIAKANQEAAKIGITLSSEDLKSKQKRIDSINAFITNLLSGFNENFSVDVINGEFGVSKLSKLEENNKKYIREMSGKLEVEMDGAKIKDLREERQDIINKNENISRGIEYLKEFPNNVFYLLRDPEDITIDELLEAKLLRSGQVVGNIDLSPEEREKQEVFYGVLRGMVPYYMSTLVSQLYSNSDYTNSLYTEALISGKNENPNEIVNRINEEIAELSNEQERIREKIKEFDLKLTVIDKVWNNGEITPQAKNFYNSREILLAESMKISEEIRDLETRRRKIDPREVFQLGEEDAKLVNMFNSREFKDYQQAVSLIISDPMKYKDLLSASMKKIRQEIKQLGSELKKEKDSEKIEILTLEKSWREGQLSFFEGVTKSLNKQKKMPLPNFSLGQVRGSRFDLSSVVSEVQGTLKEFITNMVYTPKTEREMSISEKLGIFGQEGIKVTNLPEISKVNAELATVLEDRLSSMIKGEGQEATKAEILEFILEQAKKTRASKANKKKVDRSFKVDNYIEAVRQAREARKAAVAAIIESKIIDNRIIDFRNKTGIALPDDKIVQVESKIAVIENLSKEIEKAQNEGSPTTELKQKLANLEKNLIKFTENKVKGKVDNLANVLFPGGYATSVGDLKDLSELIEVLSTMTISRNDTLAIIKENIFKTIKENMSKEVISLFWNKKNISNMKSIFNKIGTEYNGGDQYSIEKYMDNISEYVSKNGKKIVANVLQTVLKTREILLSFTPPDNNMFVLKGEEDIATQLTNWCFKNVVGRLKIKLIEDKKNLNLINALTKILKNKTE